MTIRAKDLPLVVKCDLKTYETEEAASHVLGTRPLCSVFLLGMPRSLKQAYAQLAVDMTHLETLKIEAQLPRYPEDFYDDDGNKENHESLDGWTDALSYATAPPCDIDNGELDPFKAEKYIPMQYTPLYSFRAFRQR
jgi:hypothetical protein